MCGLSVVVAVVKSDIIKSVGIQQMLLFIGNRNAELSQKGIIHIIMTYRFWTVPLCGCQHLSCEDQHKNYTGAQRYQKHIFYESGRGGRRTEGAVVRERGNNSDDNETEYVV